MERHPLASAGILDACIMSRVDAMADAGRVHAVLLAAGAGTRFCDVGHKLTAELPEASGRRAESVFARSLAALLEARIGPVSVVTGRLSAGDLGLTERTDVTCIHNHDWESGQISSVRAGLEWAAADGADVVVIGLADQPGIEPAAWSSVAQAARSGALIAVATYDGRRANPVALHRDVWDLLPIAGDEGARVLMRLRPDLVVEVPCSGSPNDIDTVKDLTQWQSN